MRTEQRVQVSQSVDISTTTGHERYVIHLQNRQAHMQYNTREIKVLLITCQALIRWFGHVQCMEDRRKAKEALS